MEFYPLVLKAFIFHEARFYGISALQKHVEEDIVFSKRCKSHEIINNVIASYGYVKSSQGSLAYQNLCYIDLSGENCDGINFRGADFQGGVLKEASFERCDFSGANLNGVCLSHGKFRGSNFSSASLSSADLRGGCFEDCNFENASIIDANLGVYLCAGPMHSSRRINSRYLSGSPRGQTSVEENLTDELYLPQRRGDRPMTPPRNLRRDIRSPSTTTPPLPLSQATTMTDLHQFVAPDIATHQQGIPQAGDGGRPPEIDLLTLPGSFRGRSAMQHDRRYRSSSAGPTVAAGDGGRSGFPLSREYSSIGQFARANFAGARLDGSTLSKSDFSGANFHGASMTKANMSGANFVGVNLAATNLACSNFSGANVQMANMSGATITNVNFEHAVMAAVNMTDADIQGTIFSAEQHHNIHL